MSGCIIIELGISGRIELEKDGMRRKSMINRKLIVKSEKKKGDVLIDEDMKNMKEKDKKENVKSWIEYISGEKWNKLKIR
jgi:Golgi phosphoprotein 3